MTAQVMLAGRALSTDRSRASAPARCPGFSVPPRRPRGWNEARHPQNAMPLSTPGVTEGLTGFSGDREPKDSAVHMHPSVSRGVT